jgi:hypothetical protein
MLALESGLRLSTCLCPPRGPHLPAVGGAGWCLLLVRRTSCYNISYLQLAHLPQVFGAAFLPSYLPD